MVILQNHVSGSVDGGFNKAGMSNSADFPSFHAISCNTRTDVLILVWFQQCFCLRKLKNLGGSGHQM